MVRVSDLKAGSIIERLGETISVLDVHTHMRFGLEILARRGRQRELWFSANIAQRWLDDALAVDIPL